MNRLDENLLPGSLPRNYLVLLFKIGYNIITNFAIDFRFMVIYTSLMTLNQQICDNYTMNPRFQIRQCRRDGCRLRFTIQFGDPRGERCPICHAPTEVVIPPASQVSPEALPVTEAEGTVFDRFAVGREVGQPRGPEMEVLLDNIRSAWNVGSMLRTCDGAGVRHAHLCGVSSTPDNPKVAKTSLGAEKSLPWSFHPDGVTAARAFHEQGMRLWALEGGPRAVSLFDAATDLPGAPIVLVAGNELSGVDPGILEQCERVVCLPMQGIKGSLNVAVAFGIAVYFMRFGGAPCASV